MDRLIIVGSAGSPNEAVELLKINENLNIPTIICIHFTGGAMETFAYHIELTTRHSTIIVTKPTELKPGVYLPEGGKDIVFLSENIVNSVQGSGNVHPSISHLFESLVKFENNNSIIIVLGGLGDDGKEYARTLKEKGARFIIQKYPRFPYLPENIARTLQERYEKMELSKIKELIINLNRRIYSKQQEET